METQDTPSTQPQSNLPVTPLAPVMSVGDWMLTLLIFCIPFLGLVMLFVWMFNGSSNPNKVNYCKALLILSAVAFVFFIFFSSMITTLFISAFR